jgi:hypothetical protein
MVNIMKAKPNLISKVKFGLSQRDSTNTTKNVYKSAKEQNSMYDRQVQVSDSKRDNFVFVES